MQCRDTGPDALTPSHGAVLPFLPTLAVAMLIGGFSLYCPRPAPPEASAPPTVVSEAARIGADGFHPAMDVATTGSIPATIAFGQLNLPVLPSMLAAELPAAKAAPERAVRLATTMRRPCVGPRCGEGRRAETARVIPVRPTFEHALPPVRAEHATSDELLSHRVIASVSTAAVWADDMRKASLAIGADVGERAAALGGSVAGILTD